ncbi:hypothetical protein [Veronia pacifica]|uniref:Transglycosylase SLT domain-containing protein n=1 Tax=Veronia pacifica TaxID=1080227 RepID=A0A1C3EAE3_9GAMM|nr:hypothetical protein [Veronia pacifica]ODA30215.1 hypothetical protein A8L45_20635 [Veronia pacifica]
MDATQLYTLVIRPVLRHLGLYTPAAGQLVLGTIYQESGAHYLRQLGKGPALGIIQMEPATYQDIWHHFLAYRPALADKLRALVSQASLKNREIPDDSQLVSNLAFAVAMCRVHYLRVPEPLPADDCLTAQAAYWKKYYNTALGKGEARDFIRHFPAGVFPPEKRRAHEQQEEDAT